MRTTAPAPRGRRRRAQDAGSAYLIVMMVLVLVTLLGLSLAFVTQTEMVIGANEKLSNKVFYSAESGIALTVARTLVKNDKAAYTVNIESEPDLSTGVPLTANLDVSPVAPVVTPWCTLCQINNSGSYNSDGFFNVTHAFTVRAQLRAPNDTVITSKTLTDNVSVQPWPYITEDVTPENEGAKEEIEL